jgi:SOS-response transcriptional repressor LexA
VEDVKPSLLPLAEAVPVAHRLLGVEPTERQGAILSFITGCVEDRGYPPTLREIGDHFGIRSTNGVNDHLRALERRGLIRREGLHSRAIRIVGVRWIAIPTTRAA